RSCAILFLNLSLILLFSAGTYNLLRDAQKNRLYQHERKPLYNFTAYAYGFVFPFIYLLVMVYFLVFGSRIVQLLDSECFRLKGQRSKSTFSASSSRRIVWAIVLFDYCSCMIVFKRGLLYYLSQP